jgi:hypothetical protein
MKFPPFFLLLPLLFISQSCSESHSSPNLNKKQVADSSAGQKIDKHFDSNWALDKIWEDGKAEVARYDAERVVYGKTRNFEYVFATVKEKFNEEFLTKTDRYNRDDLFDAMKLNMFARIETDNYPYHYLTSVFHYRNDPTQAFKLTSSSQEWCGATFQEFLTQDDGRQFIYHSYWDGQGDGETLVEGAFLMEDELPYALRALKFEEGLSFSYPLLPSIINGRAKLPARPYEARFSVTETEVELPERGKLPAWKVSVSGGNKSLTYHFGKSYPNYLYQMETSTGIRLVLKDVERWAYWMW